MNSATNGSVTGDNMLTGEVIAQTFLGPVTRLKVSGGLIADMSTARAAALPVGAHVNARVPAEGASLLSLPDES